MRDLYPASSEKNCRPSRHISRGGALHRKGERISSVVPPFQEFPRCFSPFQRNLFSLHCLDFHAEDLLPPRWHVGQPSGKASWESLVGKPRGKDSRENHRSFDPRGGLRDTAATALEESASACPHSRRGLTPLGRLQKYPKIHVSTGEESSGSGPEFTQGLRPRHQRERNSERPPRNSHGDWPFLRPPERVPEGPVGRLQKYPKIHVSTGEESSGSGPEFTQGLRPRHQRERNSERPPRNSHGDWPFLRPPERVPEGPVPRIDSHHVCTWDSPVGKPRGKASWESLVGKTRGKTIDPLIHAADCVTLLLPLWRKAQVHARIRDED
ncbi:hypothetical protein MJG53_016550 [Ovis ammon polii x Ovis aries]|uniref:Uncharacterized protein n=1 Tax=Ovis ammon polii x Ovis aries TaxID=2918886 RepID=A0ACB9U9J4_9CETA|nr:hypothetical protein MJG53_016550 [Ovis ammon polii x Ovis aries]